MPDILQYIIVIVIILAALLVSRRIALLNMQKAYKNIIDDLKSNNALGAETAIDLPYAKPKIIRIGLKDHRSKILSQLIAHGIVEVNEEGKYFLNESSLSQPEAKKNG